MSAEHIYLVARASAPLSAWQTQAEAAAEADRMNGEQLGHEVFAVHADGALCLALAASDGEQESPDMLLHCNVKLRWAAALGTPSGTPLATATLEQMTATAIVAAAPEGVMAAAVRKLLKIVDHELGCNESATKLEQDRLLIAKRRIEERLRDETRRPQ